MAHPKIHPIRKARLRRNLSQAALGERVGVQKPAISAFENGKKLPKPTIAKKLASELGISLEQVYEAAA